MIGESEPVVGATDPALAERLARAIALAGPIPVSQFMGAANAHYYATRDPLGRDFTTAPEVSQTFGELVGLCLADLWDRAGRPAAAAYAELGPGRGTLAGDALRVMARAGLQPPIHLVEFSPVLRAAQAERLPGAHWHATLDALPAGAPLLLVANEFLDALPIRQIVRTGAGWRERLVASQDTLFLPIPGHEPLDALIPPGLADAPPGSILETSPAQVTAVRQIARRIVAQGGGALLIDYGYAGPAVGDTLQAIRDGRPANPFDAPGEADLTAHVDFATLAEAARAEGAVVHGPVEQGRFLHALGLDSRVSALARAHPERAEELLAQRNRLAGPGQMGMLFKVLAITHPDWPIPAGLA